MRIEAAVGELLKLAEFVDVIVPRGGKGLIERISRESRIPVIKHLHGVCHTYIDDQADIDKAVKVAFNAKTQRYGTCNTMETLLVHEAMADAVLPALAERYTAATLILIVIVVAGILARFVYDAKSELLFYTISWQDLEDPLHKLHLHGPATAADSNPNHLIQSQTFCRLNYPPSALLNGEYYSIRDEKTTNLILTE